MADEIMKFEEFQEYIVNNIKEYLSPDYEDAEISSVHMLKNNGVMYDGLSIRKPDRGIAPTIYINDMYNRYVEGMDADTVLEKITMIATESENTNIDVSNIQDYKSVKDKIYGRVINYESNIEYLRDKPYTRVEDLAIVYQIRIMADSQGVGSITITNQYADEYGVTAEELQKVAVQNELARGYKLRTLEEIMVEMMAENLMREEGLNREESIAMAESFTPPMPADSMMYVLTNNETAMGVMPVMIPEIRDDVARIIGGDYFVLPSSVHEVILVPALEGANYLDLEDMVKSVNETQVLPEEKLSDHVYQYDAKEHIFCLAERMEEVRNERTAGEVKKDTEEPLRGKISLKAKINENNEKNKAGEKYSESVKASDIVKAAQQTKQECTEKAL